MNELMYRYRDYFNASSRTRKRATLSLAENSGVIFCNRKVAKRKLPDAAYFLSSGGFSEFAGRGSCPYSKVRHPYLSTLGYSR